MSIKKLIVRKKVSMQVQIGIIAFVVLALYSSFEFFRWNEHHRTVSLVSNYVDKEAFILAELELKKYLQNNKGSSEIYHLKLKMLQKKSKYAHSVAIYTRILKTIMFLYNKGMINEQTYHTSLAKTYFNFDPLYYERVLYHNAQIDLNKLKDLEKINLLRMDVIVKEALGYLDEIVNPLEKLNVFAKNDIQVVVRLARGYVFDGRLVFARKILEENFFILSKLFEKDESKKKDLLILSYCLVDIFDRMGLNAEKHYYNVMLNSLSVDNVKIKDLQNYLSNRKEEDDLYVFNKGYIDPLKVSFL